MKIFYIFVFYFIFIFPSYGFDSFYVYVKNATPHTLVLPHGGRVLPNAQAIFGSFPTSNIHGVQHDVRVQGHIYVKDKGKENCHLNFTTYANFDTFTKEQYDYCFTKIFSTFIVVSEKDSHLICTPVAAQVSSKCGNMMPNGSQLTITEAKEARKKFEKIQELELQKRRNQNNPSTPLFNSPTGTFRFNPLLGKYEFIPFKKD